MGFLQLGAWGFGAGRFSERWNLASDGKALIRRRLSVLGQVQGVGFRPFVYRLACELGLTGFVVNDARGVSVEVQGTAGALESFERRLMSELPPLASIRSVAAEAAEASPGEGSFEIRPSAGELGGGAEVTVDTATCADCLRELFDPGDPRGGYPFINCTHCGPRYTIVRRVPYDRANTTMSGFAMCDFCGGQYADPSDRRFHAQPVACPACGPRVWLADASGKRLACDDPIARTAEMLRDGRIVAIKGLGGFHLACRGDDEAAVVRLRRRKRRDAKPFALMVADLGAARALAHVDAAAAGLLAGAIRPIVLLPRRAEAPVAPAVAEGLAALGVMLPYTPLHHLLLARAACPLVMTSGNHSDEPLVKDNDEAVACLGEIADALLLHDRPIERRIDDSVAQLHADGRVCLLRRARGYAPQAIRVPGGGAQRPRVLGVGAELKATVCMLAGGRAILSGHIGDLKDARTYRQYVDTIAHTESLFDFAPDLLAADLHPQYLATEYALRRAGEQHLPVERVQHHHAHVAACLAEHGRTGPVIGLACDGVGYGDDGAAWGCEILRADLCGYERLGHLRYMALPGGDAAARETFRPALAALHDALGSARAAEAARKLLPGEADRVEGVLEMLDRGVNCPPASSLGRWFDAAAALCGLAGANRFEGEAPMRLESAAGDKPAEAYPFELDQGGPFRIDLRPMVAAMVSDLAGPSAAPGTDAGRVAARFHETVAAFLSAAARRAREASGLGVVALSGGCFANRRLTARLTELLSGDGFEVLRHVRIPCNDGCVALGQAVVAAARRQGAPGRTEPGRTRAKHTERIG